MRLQEQEGAAVSGELIVAEKSEEKRCELVFEQPAPVQSQLEGAGGRH
jgi:hypothetical protein